MRSHKHMQTNTLLALGGLLLGAASSHAQSSTATTVPVGCLTQTIAAATGNGPANGTVALPLYTAAVYAGLVTSVDGSTAFSSSSAAWTANQFTATPFFVRIKSGNNVGRCFPVTANTATQLSVSPQGATDTQPYNLTTLLSVGDAFEVLPANTLGSLFGLTGGPFLTGSTAGAADNLYLWDVVRAAWSVYFNNGTHWRSAASLQNQDNIILYPEEGMYIVHRDTVNPLTFSFLGTVPSTTERTDIPGTGSVCVANRFPLDTTLGGLALQNLSGWLSGTTAPSADDVYVWNPTKNAWDVCFYNGSHWRSASSLQNIETTETVPAGTALFIVRQSASTASNATFVESLPYSANSPFSTNARPGGALTRPGAGEAVSSARFNF